MLVVDLVSTPHDMRAPIRRRCLWLLALATLTLGACGDTGHAMPHDLAPPAGASTYTGEASTTSAQLAMNDLRTRLQQHYAGRWDIQRYDLDRGTAWDAVLAHYAHGLGSDFQRDDRYAEDAGPGYRSAVWGDSDRAAAVALSPGATPEEHPVLTVFLPESAR